MGSSSNPLLVFPPPPPARPRSLRIRASSLPSPAPRTKRKNHLRRKLPKPYEPFPPPPRKTLQTPPPPPEPPAAHVLFIEDTEVVEEVVHEAEGVDPFPLVAHRWFPGPVIDLSLRYAALFAVQTVAALWILGTDGGGRVEGAEGEKEVRREVGDALEFERKVSEIRAMAKEARESEAKDAGDRIANDKAYSSHLHSSENIGGKKDGEKLNSRRKIGSLGSKCKERKVPKGFKGSKSRN